MNDHTMCSYCHSVNGGHTMACQALALGDEDEKRQVGFAREQVPIPRDAPYWKRLKAHGREVPVEVALERMQSPEVGKKLT